MPLGDVEGAELPDAAIHMLNARLANRWLGTAWSPEDAAQRDPLFWEILRALIEALEPPQAGNERQTAAD